MDPAYAARYGDLYRRHWWWRTRERVVVRELRALPLPPGPRRLLDVGCGDGLLFDRLAELGEPEGVEPDVDLLTPDGRWRHRIHALPFEDFRGADASYHVILMLDVLEHLPDPVAALRHAVRLLAPGGALLITVPALQWLWTRHDDFNRHVRRFDRPSFRAVAGAAGVRIRKERYLFQWLVPAKLAVRAIEALRPGAGGPATVPPAPLNAALRTLSGLEEWVTRKLPVPFGSSLLVVAGAAGPAGA